MGLNYCLHIPAVPTGEARMTAPGPFRKAKFSMTRRYTTLQSANSLKRLGSGRKDRSCHLAPSAKRAANKSTYGLSKTIGTPRPSSAIHSALNGRRTPVKPGYSRRSIGLSGSTSRPPILKFLKANPNSWAASICYGAASEVNRSIKLTVGPRRCPSRRPIRFNTRRR